MKLKPGGKIFLFLLLGVIAFFVIRKYQPAKTTDVTTETVDNSATNTNANKKLETTGSKTSDGPARTEGRTFDYTAEKPVNGALKGVVEVGAAGFNSFVINMDNQKRWEIV